MGLKRLPKKRKSRRKRSKRKHSDSNSASRSESASRSGTSCDRKKSKSKKKRRRKHRRKRSQSECIATIHKSRTHSPLQTKHATKSTRNQSKAHKSPFGKWKWTTRSVDSEGELLKRKIRKRNIALMAFLDEDTETFASKRKVIDLTC